MEYKALTTTSDEFAAAKEIYLEAFPAAERDKTFEQYVAFCENNQEGTATVVLDEGQVAGFYIYFDLEDFYFLAFLAVNGAIRGKGYGAKIMAHILDICQDTTAIGLIEAPDESAPNNAQRLARRSFYERNNMYAYKLGHTALGVTYDLVSNKADLDLDACRDSMAAAIAAVSERV